MSKVNNDLMQKYSKANIVIHWLTAILVLSLFPLGKYMGGLSIPEKTGLIKIHALLGLIILLLTLIRSYLFFKSKKPNDLKTGSRFNDKLTVWIHNSFYFLLIGISITGLATMFTGNYLEILKSEVFDLTLPKEKISSLKAHGLLATIMVILLVLHVLGVIKHYLLTKENTLKRIS